MNDSTTVSTARRSAPSLLAPEELAGPLSALLGERFGRGESFRAQFLATEGLRSTTPPWAVTQPRTVQEVQAIHRLCHESRAPLIPYGAGSSVEGQVAAEPGSLMLDMRGLDGILEIDTQTLTARVQAGVTRLQLDAALKDTGLFFPVDPGANATLGGMAATRASGTNAVRYGTMRENTLGLQAVLADGELIRCGSAAAKASNGYDLLHLFVGSEGTLGTIVELTVRLHPRPETVAGAVFCFDDIESAVAAVTDFRSAGVPIARVELLDATTVGALNQYANLGLPDAHLLMVELHGSASGVREQFELVASLVAELPGTRQMYAHDATRRAELWTACHKRYYACRALKPGARAIATDVCVPLARLAQTVNATLADIAGMPMPVTLHGHVGDGNFHTVVLYDEDCATQTQALKDYCERLALRAIANGGTCSGEHGIGIGKQRYLRQEHGNALDWMRRIKQLFDPLGIMNPGKNVDLH